MSFLLLVNTQLFDVALKLAASLIPLGHDSTSQFSFIGTLALEHNLTGSEAEDKQALNLNRHYS